MLAETYRDAVLLVNESKRAIDSYTGEIPGESPYRYLRMSVGDAVLAYLSKAGKPQTIKQLCDELQNGHVIFGAVKTPMEIVLKSVKAYIQAGRMVWMDRGKTLVGIPEWKRGKRPTADQRG